MSLTAQDGARMPAPYTHEIKLFDARRPTIGVSKGMSTATRSTGCTGLGV